MDPFNDLEATIIGNSRPAPLESPSPVPADVSSGCRALLAGFGSSPPWSLAVTSAVRGAGRTTIADAIAWLQRSEYGRPTVRLALDAHAGAPPQPGSLEDVLDGRAQLLDAVDWMAPQYGVLTLPGDADGSASLMTRLGSSSLVADLESHGYAVVGDLPPLLPPASVTRVVTLFDSSVLVVRAGSTSARQVKEALALFPGDQPKVLLNRVGSAVPAWLRRFGLGR